MAQFPKSKKIFVTVLQRCRILPYPFDANSNGLLSVHRVVAIFLVILYGIAIPSRHASANEELLAYGQYLASECVTCHQITGEDKGIPPIVGWEPFAFVEVLKSYREKERDHKVMQTVAGALSDEEMKALAAYFGSITPSQN